MSRCPIRGLPVEVCSHCQRFAESPKATLDAVRAEEILGVTVRYRARCVGCGGPLLPGQFARGVDHATGAYAHLCCGGKL